MYLLYINRRTQSTVYILKWLQVKAKIIAKTKKHHTLRENNKFVELLFLGLVGCHT